MSDSPTAENDAPDCRCPEGPSASRHREGEHECGRCSGFACGYADRGQTRCPSWRCDCFIEAHPDSPMDLHPEDFIVGRVTPPGNGDSQ